MKRVIVIEKVLTKGNVNFKIRKILPKDNRYMAEIVRYNLKNHGLDIPGTAYFDEGLDTLSEFYSKSPTRGYFVLVDDEDNVMGGIGFAEFSGIDDCAELQKLYLSDSVKGIGMGYELICYIEEKMIEAGFAMSYLETHENLKTAMHIYEKSGYSQIERPENVVHGTMTHFYLKKLVVVENNLSK